MTDTTARPQVRSDHDEWLDRRWSIVRLLIVTLAVVAAALLVTTGMRPASYGDLLADVASSKVDEVRVIGADAPGRGDTLEVRWTVLGGLLDQYAEVRVDDSRGYDAWEDDVFVSAVDPRDTLRSINADLTITSDSPRHDLSASFYDWRAPGPVALLALAAWLAVLLLLIGGPEPWRATRWAWAWFVLLAGPLGVVAYLLVGGPSGLARPRPGHRRLTGGWAFLLAMGLFGSNVGAG